MNFNTVCLPITLAVLQACTLANTDPEKSSLYSEQQNQEFIKPRDVLKFASGEVVSDCKGYLKLSPQQAVSEEYSNKINAKQYLVCDLFGAYGPNSILPSEPGFDPELGQEICKELNLLSFEHSLRPMLDGNPITLKDVFKADAIPNGTECKVDTKDRSFTIRVVLKDTSPKGEVRFLATVCDEIKDGNYQDYQSIWIYRSDSNKKPGMKAGSLYLPTQ
ncbi:MAG: hypothetical protein QE278_00060 [Limnobacter sp.]|nr:hypothetical protein [Limnobacter sp.]